MEAVRKITLQVRKRKPDGIGSFMPVPSAPISAAETPANQPCPGVKRTQVAKPADCPARVRRPAPQRALATGAISETQPYKVGKGKPPLETRFKPGERRSPGRPKGSKNTSTIAREELDRRVKVKGHKKKLSMREISIKQQVKKAACGDAKALETLLKIEGTLSFSASRMEDADRALPLPVEDHKILEFMRGQIHQSIALEHSK